MPRRVEGRGDRRGRERLGDELRYRLDLVGAAGQRLLDRLRDERQGVGERQLQDLDEGAVAVGQMGAEALPELLEARREVAVPQRRGERLYWLPSSSGA